MSWSIYATGTVDGVEKFVEKAEVYGNLGGLAAKTFIMAVCDGIPAEHRPNMYMSVNGGGHDGLGDGMTLGSAKLEISFGRILT